VTLLAIAVPAFALALWMTSILSDAWENLLLMPLDGPKTLTMKNRLTFFAFGIPIILLSVVAGIVGCAAFRNGAPPTALERAFYDTQTNYVPTLALRTNVTQVTTYQTNTVSVTVTNPVGVIEYHTNAVVVPVLAYLTNTVLVTNAVPNFTRSPNSNLKGAEEVISTIPIYGTLASTALAGIAAVWGWFRSS
jgi:hypothetical protein